MTGSRSPCRCPGPIVLWLLSISCPHAHYRGKQKSSLSILFYIRYVCMCVQRLYV
jgi:hypothetical protein